MPIDYRAMLSTGRLGGGSTPGVFGQIQQGLQQANQENDANAARKAQLEMQKMQYEQQRQMQEAQLSLQRQKFAYDKAEADRMADVKRKELKRKDDEEKLALQTKHAQLLLSGDEAGADAMLPEFEARGGQAVLERRENGLPVYRYYQDKGQREKEDAEYARRLKMAAVDQDILPESVSIERGGTVVDVPAAEARRRAEAEAVLGEQNKAFTDPDRQAIDMASARAALRMPGSSRDKLKAYDTLQQGPATDYRGQQMGRAQVNAARESRAQNTESRLDTKAEYELRDFGEKKAKEAGENIGLDKYREMHDSLKLAAEAMHSNTPTDHQIAGRNLARVLANEKGPMSNQDISGILGNDTESFLSKIEKGLYKEAFGGIHPDKRNALIKLAEKKLGTMESNLYGYMDRVENDAETERNPNVAEGLRRYIDRNVDDADRKSWREKRDAGKKPKTGASSSPGDEIMPVGKADLPKTLDGGGSGDVEKVIGTWLGKPNHPAAKFLAQHFTYDSAGGPVDDAVGEYLTTLQADYPVEWAAAEKGNTAPLEKALLGAPAAKDPDVLTREEANATIQPRSAADARALELLAKMRSQ